MPTMAETDAKKARQARQYAFPYHYLPHLEDGSGSRFRSLEWGLEYLAYQGFIRDVVAGLVPETVLEVGCGDGSFLNGMETNVRRLGVDLDERAIGLARAMSAGAEFRCCAASEIDEVFDVVLAIEVLEHVPDEAVGDFIGALRDRVRPGGHLVLTVPSTVLPLNPKHFRHYDEALLVEQLRGAFAASDEIVTHRVYREPWWLRLHLKATQNRFWFFESAWTRGVVWRAIQRHCLRADARDGRHVVAVVHRAVDDGSQPEAG